MHIPFDDKRNQETDGVGARHYSISPLDFDPGIYILKYLYRVGAIRFSERHHKASNPIANYNHLLLGQDRTTS